MVTYGVKLDVVTIDDGTATILAELFDDVLNVTMASSWDMVRTELQVGPNPVGPTYTSFAGTGGGVGGEVGFPQAAWLVQKRTAFGGRENRGRFYIPGLSESIVDTGGVILSVNVALAQTELDEFHTGLQAADLPMYVLHNSASLPTAVTSLVADATIATQRRRLR